MKIFILCDDPGAANYMKNLPKIFSKKTSKIKIFLTSEILVGYFQEHINKIEVSTVDVILEKLQFVGNSEPVVLFTGTSEDVTFVDKVIRHSKLYFQKCYCFIDSSVNSEYRFYREVYADKLLRPDFLVVPDSFTGMCFEELGFEKGEILIYPHWWLGGQCFGGSSHNGERQLRKEKYDVLFVSELSNGLGSISRYERNEEYLIFGSGKYKGRTEIVIEEVLHCFKSIRPRIHLVLRPHPKQNSVTFTGLMQCFDSYLDCPRKGVHLKDYDLIVGLSSTMLLEAAALNLPVLSILPRLSERKWLGPWQSRIKTVHKRHDIKKILTNPHSWSQLQVTNVNDCISNRYPTFTL